MKKKIVYSIIAILVLIAGVFTYNYFTNREVNVGDKKIEVIIKNQDELIYQSTVDTDTTTLKDLVLELIEDKEIVVDYENGPYGMYVKAMGKDELISENQSEGLFWVYESPNNIQCKEAGFCDVMDNLVIDDQDSFSFILKSFE